MKNEYYQINGDKGEVVNGAPSEEVIKFKVLATSHTQHNPATTHLDGLSSRGMEKIRKARGNGFRLSVNVGNRAVGIENK